MDAKVGDWVVTPRHGKPVEINALYHHALRVAQGLATRFRETDFESLAGSRADGVEGLFEATYRNEETGCLYDLVGHEGNDGAIRPNQVLAISVSGNLVSEARRKQALAVVEHALLTPRGLRSLSPSHPEYRGTYGGDQHSRDSAYHQGTVWGWLIGPFITAYVSAQRESDSAREAAAGILEPFQAHLHEAGLGQISEIFDGEAPHHARGCFAQAWSVAEVLRSYVEDVLGDKPEPWLAPIRTTR